MGDTHLFDSGRRGSPKVTALAILTVRKKVVSSCCLYVFLKIQLSASRWENSDLKLLPAIVVVCNSMGK